MIKQIALVTAKPGMSREAFIDRYENAHTPLALRILNYFCGYRRNYVVPGSGAVMARPDQPVRIPDFDGISEFWFSDQSMLDEMARAIGETDAGPQIAEDEAQVFDRSKIRMFGVDEYVTGNTRSPASDVTKPAVKLILLASKKASMSSKEFIDYYESKHVPLALELLGGEKGSPLSGYRRSYPAADTNKMPHLDANSAPLGFDVLTEVTFATEADYESFKVLAQRPEFAEAIAADEEKLFDRPSMLWFMVDEHVTSPSLLGTSKALSATKCA